MVFSLLFTSVSLLKSENESTLAGSSSRFGVSSSWNGRCMRTSPGSTKLVRQQRYKGCSVTRQRPKWFIETKEKLCIKIEFNYHKTVHRHRDVNWTHFILWGDKKRVTFILGWNCAWWLVRWIGGFSKQALLKRRKQVITKDIWSHIRAMHLLSG